MSSPSGTTYLAPFSSVLVEAKSGPASVHVDVIAQTAGSLSGITPQLLATWAQAPDDVPAVSAGAGNPTPPFFRFRDEFFWPCMAGETFPPTFGSGGTSYTAKLGKPAVGIPASGSHVWPSVPRSSVRDASLRVLTVSWYWIATGGASQFGQGIDPATFATNSPSWKVLTTAGPPTGVYRLTCQDAAGGLSGVDSTIHPSQTIFDLVAVVLTDTATTLFVNGVQAAVNAAHPWLATDALTAAGTTGLQLVLPSSGGAGDRLSQLKASYS